MYRSTIAALLLLLAFIGAQPRALAKLTPPEKLASGFFAPLANECAESAAPPAPEPQWFSDDAATNFAPGLRKFLSEDPIGLAGGPNMYAYCNGNPITALDPSGLAMFGLYDSWSDYGHEVGEVWKGYGDAAVGTVAGLMNVAASPIQTTRALGSAIAHPVDTFNAVTTAASDSWSSGSRGQGRVVGEILIAAATMGTTKAVATAGKAEEIVQVSRWGSAGLADGNWVQLGGVNKWNLGKTGKWSSAGGNQVVPLAEVSSGTSFNVASSALHWPVSGNPLSNVIKGTLGQRIYDTSRVSMSYGAASTVGIGVGAGIYGTAKAGEAAFYK